MSRFRHLLIPWIPFALLLTALGAYIVSYNVLTLCQSTSTPCVPEAGLRSGLDSLLTVQVGNAPLAVRFQALAGRLQWAAAVGFSLFGTAIGLAIGVLAVSRVARLRAPEAVTALLTFSLLILSAAVYLVLRPTWGLPTHPWRQLLNASLIADSPQVATWNPRLDSLGLLVAFYFTFAAAVIIRVCTTTTVDRQLLVRICTYWLSAILYSGAALLVIAVFRMHAVFQWSLAYFPLSAPPDPAAAILNSARDLGERITAVIGAFYSILLAAIYFPTAVVVSQAATDKQTTASGTDLSGTRDHSLAIPIASLVPRLLALLSPLLTGWAAGALDAFSH